jgi:predicted dehydrogenase
MKKWFAVMMFLLLSALSNAQSTKPFRIGIAGLTHTHVHWILERADDGDIEIVGIAEPNRELAERFLKQHNLPMSLVFSSLEEMVERTKPEAVTAFNSIDEHLQVVRVCAPRKVHVMVEKPLAISLVHAREMESLAKKFDIELLTNYETTWYGSHFDAMRELESRGPIRKIVVHDGHKGPQEIGVNKEFLEWLTDPAKNGGGAITDFGCYGANLMTWFLNGERPSAVSAITQQLKPDVYPNVDDEATILVIYPKAQGIIQASWNWPYNRKDIELYAQSGMVIADREGLRFRSSYDAPETFRKSSPPMAPFHDPFALLAAVVRKQVSLKRFDPSSLENNMLVMEILDAAKRSAKERKVIELK